MGIVKKQVYKNTVVSYTGMAIGFINLILLYPRFFTTEQLGLFQLLIALSVLYSLVASMGVPSIIVKYFPFYRSEDKIHNGFVPFVGRLALVGFVLSTFVFFVLKPVIVASFNAKAHLFVEYYYYLIPLTLFTVFFNFLEAFSKAVYRSIYSAVLKEIVLRLLTTVSMFALALHYINFQLFIITYIVINGMVCFFLLVNLTFSGHFSYGKFSNLNFKRTNNEAVNFGLFTLLSTTVYILLQNVDKYMLSAMAGLAIQGVYSLYSNVAIVISVPAQALSRTTYQIVADSWKSGNMDNISEVYTKTSIIQMVAGFLLFVGIMVNKENLLFLLHKKEFAEQFNVLIFICLGFLVDITGGLNTYIVTTSHKYRLVTVIITISSVICILLTYALVPRYGGLGAAVAYLITITGINFFMWLYIKLRFRMQPFSYKHLIVIIVAAISYVSGYYLWRLPNVYADILVRSIVTAIVYLAFCYVFHISEDVNEKIDRTLIKLHLKAGLNTKN